MKTLDKIRKWFAGLNIARIKKVFYIACMAIMVLWVIYRFVSVALESRRDVFNTARDAAVNGVPVHVIEMHKTNGVLREPVFVTHNRIYVSGARINLFRTGMRVGEGEVVSVSHNIDYDTGMHIVTTRGVGDGANFAEYSANGFFVPVYAISDGAVFVVSGEHASRRDISVSRMDSENALVSQGLSDGDMVILSHITDGEKVSIKITEK